MRVTIDTEKDSSEDIKKVISFLQQFVGQSSYGSSYDAPEPASSGGVFNIFGDDSSASTPSEPSSSLNTESNVFNIFEQPTDSSHPAESSNVFESSSSSELSSSESSSPSVFDIFGSDDEKKEEGPTTGFFETSVEEDKKEEKDSEGKLNIYDLEEY